jgi:hypothetical protein
MIKVAAITAALLLIALAAGFVLAYKAGKAAGRRELERDTGVRDRLYREMARFITDTVNGTSLDSEYWASLSPKSLERGEQIVAQYRRSIGQ